MADVSFQTLLRAFGNMAGLPISTTGVPTFTTTEEARFCGRLNDAARWLWFTAMPRRALPGMLTGKTVTLASGGKVATADIEGSSFWSVWQSDPRAEVLMDREWARLRLEGSALSNGDIQVRGGVAGTTVYVIYKKPVPVWTVERLQELIYNTGNLVWLEQPITSPGDSPTGEVYKAQQMGSDWTDIFDTAIWQPVSLDDTLEEIVLRKANAERMRADNQLATSARAEYEMLGEALDAALLGSEEGPMTKPWLYNWNR
jgi:hypothetical protein